MGGAGVLIKAHAAGMRVCGRNRLLLGAWRTALWGRSARSHTGSSIGASCVTTNGGARVINCLPLPCSSCVRAGTSRNCAPATTTTRAGASEMEALIHRLRGARDSESWAGTARGKIPPARSVTSL